MHLFTYIFFKKISDISTILTKEKKTKNKTDAKEGSSLAFKNLHLPGPAGTQVI